MSLLQLAAEAVAEVVAEAVGEEASALEAADVVELDVAVEEVLVGVAVDEVQADVVVDAAVVEAVEDAVMADIIGTEDVDGMVDIGVDGMDLVLGGTVLVGIHGGAVGFIHLAYGHGGGFQTGDFRFM